MTHTHVGHYPTVGYVHAARNYGHADYRGRVHALNGPERPYEGARYTTLCGKAVACQEDADYGRLSVRRAEDQSGKGVTCRRCRRIISRNSQVAGLPA